MSPSPGARGGSMYPLINETGRVAVRRRLITSTKDPSEVVIDGAASETGGRSCRRRRR